MSEFFNQGAVDLNNAIRAEKAREAAQAKRERGSDMSEALFNGVMQAIKKFEATLSEGEFIGLRLPTGTFELMEARHWIPAGIVSFACLDANREDAEIIQNLFNVSLTLTKIRYEQSEPRKPIGFHSEQTEGK